MRVVHLSDIHLSQTNLYDLKSFFLEALINDLKVFNDKKAIDLLLFTGDLIDKGGESFGGPTKAYECFETEFINPIISKLKLPKEKVLFIPGNHDVDRNQIDKTYEKGLVAEIISIETANTKLIEIEKNFNLINGRIKGFKDFEEKFHKDTSNYFYTNNQSLFIFESEGVKIGFALINDSWRCSDNLKPEQHFVGINQFLNAKQFFSENSTDFNVVLLHHPLEVLNREEQKELKNIINKFDFELVIYGHTHQFDLNYSFGVSGNAIFINAKSAFNNPRIKYTEYESGYSIIDVDVKTLGLECNFRKYIHSRFEFDSDTNAANGGVYKTKLTPKGQKATLYNSYELADKTINSHLDDFNNSLIVYKTNTIAPKEIEKLFVEPKLTDKPIQTSKEEVKFYSVDDLLSAETSLLFLGEKEAGKTTLLNKLCIEAGNRFFTLKKIPIYIDFKSLTKLDVINCARKYLNEPTEKIEQLASRGELLLLVDNYDELESLSVAKNHLKAFNNTYPNNLFFLSTSSKLEKILQVETNLVGALYLTPIFIGSVGVREFKKLALKWFRNKDEQWHQKNIEKLIKVFKILKIPRTFFSMSLYLWIIEKQESFKPINKSYLVNKFLQFILEGLIEEEGKAGSFNFDRKKEMLTEIAFEMFNKGDSLDSYALSKEEIIQAISNYNGKNQRSFDANKAFTLFFEKGIFKIFEVEGEEKICFRFESFFQFFLSYNLDTNIDFRQRVLNRDEILSFIDEIDYYTGRHQNSKELLNHSINLLKDSFEQIDSIIKDDTDQYLPKKLVLLKDVDDKKIQSEIDSSSGIDDIEQEKLFEKQMENLPVSDSIKVKKRHNYEVDFIMSVELAARVLKNAENIQDPKLINTSLDLIIQKTAKYGIFIQAILSKEFKDGKQKDYPFPLPMLILFGPFFNQHMLLQWIGTDFLQVPLANKINGYLNAKKSSQKQKYEQFLSIFLYVDLKLPDYIALLRKAVKSLDHKYFAELYFFRILMIYKLTPSNSRLRPDLKELMKLLLIKVKGISKNDANNSLKNLIDDDINHENDEEE